MSAPQADDLFSYSNDPVVLAMLRDVEESVAAMKAAEVGVTSEEVVSSASDADAFVLRAARENVNVFCEYVLRDEMTGNKHGFQADHHLDWHRLSGQHDRLILWSFPEAGKSVQLSIGRTLWMLGRNPNLRLVVISETHALARKIVRAVRTYIEESEELHRVFPGLRPARDKSWTETTLVVERDTFAKEPSLQAFGLGGRIWGSRVDHIVLDDILSPENTRTKTGRDAVFEWLTKINSRLSPDGTILAVGNAFHPDDALHRLARQEHWVWRKFPVLTPEGRSAWPSRWPLTRIDSKRRDMAGMPTEFARQFLCQARSDEDSKFKQAWIDLCLARGNGWTPPAQLRGERVVTGVDLAVQKHEAADLTVLFTVRGTGAGDREVVDVRSGRWGAPEILKKVQEVYQTFGSTFIVENNAAQDYIVQLVRSSTAIPIRGFTTGRNKAHPEFGLENMGGELANAKWVIPNHGGVCHPEVRAWIDEMLYYDPRGHTGDRLMASWFAREGLRMLEQPVPQAEVGRVSW